MLVVFLSNKIQAQQYRLPNGESSFEISFGPSTLYIGDVGAVFNEKYILDSSSPYHLPYKFINSYMSFGFHQEIDDKISYKIAVQASTYERPKPDSNGNYFLSDVFTLAARGEYNLFRVIKPHENLMYIHAGAGITYFSYTFKPNNIVPVLPIGRAAAVVPLGLGYRFYLTDKIKIGAEVNLHYVFSDLVEGRGTTTGIWPHDILMSAGLSFSYVIFKGNKAKNRCRCEWH